MFMRDSKVFLEYLYHLSFRIFPYYWLFLVTSDLKITVFIYTYFFSTTYLSSTKHEHKWPQILPLSC